MLKERLALWFPAPRCFCCSWLGAKAQGIMVLGMRGWGLQPLFVVDLPGHVHQGAPSSLHPPSIIPPSSLYPWQSWAWSPCRGSLLLRLNCGCTGHWWGARRPISASICPIHAFFWDLCINRVLHILPELCKCLLATSFFLMEVLCAHSFFSSWFWLYGLKIISPWRVRIIFLLRI